MFGWWKLLLLGFWLIGLSQGRAAVAGDWHETPEPDPTIFENKSPTETDTQINDIDPQSI